MSGTVESLQPTAPGAGRLYSYQELCELLPETNRPHELWDGELIMVPAPFYPHQKIVFRFQKLLDQWVEIRGLGEVVGAPVDMVLSPHRTVQPDVVFIAKERLGIIQRGIMGAADLVVEVVSPGGRRRDRIDKKDLYEQYGVKEYWIVDPEARTVEVLAMSNSRYELTMRCGPGQTAASTVLPGFEVTVDQLFHGV